MFRDSRPLKKWRYVGVFCEELAACAARVRVGPAKQTFWAVHVRAGVHTPADVGTCADMRTGAHARSDSASNASDAGRLRERTHTFARHGTVELAPGRIRVRDGGVLLELVLEEGEGIEARCPHGRGEVWTRKQAGVPARGSLSLDGGPVREIEALAVIDDTAGYHARRTEWWWSAGVGTSADGRALAWNLVQGVNDPPTGSERAVWIDGEPYEPKPVRFAADLSEVVAADGEKLRFAAEVERRRKENLLLVSSDYTAPFGAFTGTLPGGIKLEHGLGVVEHHRAKW